MSEQCPVAVTARPLASTETMTSPGARTGVAGVSLQDLGQRIDHSWVVLVAQPQVYPLHRRTVSRHGGAAARHVVISVADLDDPARRRQILTELAHATVSHGLRLQDDRHPVEH